MRAWLAGAELAAAVVLLVGAGLILRSFTALARVDPGFQPESVLSFRVPFPFQEVHDAGGSGRATPFYDELVDRLVALPGVLSVGYAQCTPLSQLCGLEGLTLRGTDQPVGSAESEELFVIAADGAALRRLVLRQGMAMAAAGLGAGIVVALLGGRFLASILYGVEASDLPTYFVVAALLASTALLACYLPARRAARVEPAEVLRAD